jgi:dual specificity MAP kinase phosphatase
MDYSQITDNILVGTTPRDQDYEELHELGVRLVINMRFWRGHPPAGGNPPLEYLRLRTFDSPLLPIPTKALLRGTRAALVVISKGGLIYAHCSRGRHRSVAMAAAILIAQGHTPEAAMRLIEARRAAADPRAFHIRTRIIEFGRRWSEIQSRRT